MFHIYHAKNIRFVCSFCMFGLVFSVQDTFIVFKSRKYWSNLAVNSKIFTFFVLLTAARCCDCDFCQYPLIPLVPYGYIVEGSPTPILAFVPSLWEPWYVYPNA